MKNWIKSMLVLSFFVGSCSLGFSQNCEGYHPMKKGVEFETKSYDKKNRLESTTKNVITQVTNKGGQTVAVVHAVTTDSKGEETVNANYEMICDGDKITVDTITLLKEKLSSSLSESNSDAEAKVSGTNAAMPNNLSVGQELPDSTMEMEIQSGSLKMDFGVKSFNKKVVGEETITVPAGTFDCVIITENSETKMMITKKGTNKIWYAKGVGMVKQEEYNKKGDLVGVILLSKFKA
ncbi:DUF3108 domain-containing protein [Mangrovimonas sp. CR14]|uniref:DUF3108 domain-containing protein n=1 Tax=Mangrovimonas sp. CR14 TaxID=2706120 RepID=UPI00142221BB|nr:DUF3108 domain-containing protein [Mangrovimonas sp. CR14]NIK91575.1 DUF3108 domain-containing protein [Mangrovimonas sp. CR14]